jgi:O-antigen/teichoic acid export membrane protein
MDCKASFRKEWLQKGFWAIMDQGLFAISNFLLNILLARWLSPRDYGAFTVAYSVFLLCGAFHDALLTEPMMVFGPGRFRSRLQVYLSCLLPPHVIFAFLSSTAVLVCALLLWTLIGEVPLSVLVAVAVANPFLLTSWLFRRMSFVHSGPHIAAQSAPLYLTILLIGIVALNRYQLLSPITAFAAVTFASICMVLLLIYRLNVGLPTDLRNSREILTAHWTYGRWALATSVLSWVPSNLYFLLLPIWAGLEASGALRASMNLIMPLMHIFTALGSALLPIFVKSRTRADFTAFTCRIFTALLLASVVYWLLVKHFGSIVIQWIYQEKYTLYGNLLWVIGLLPVAVAATSVFGNALRALEKPRTLFISYVCSTVVTLTAGIWLVANWGVVGAAVGWVIAYAIASGTVIWFFLRRGSFIQSQLQPLMQAEFQRNS